MEHIIQFFVNLGDLFWNLPTVWRLVIGMPLAFFLIFVVIWILFSVIPGTIQYFRKVFTGCVLVTTWRGDAFYRDVSEAGWQIYDRSWWWHINHWWSFQ